MQGVYQPKPSQAGDDLGKASDGADPAKQPADDRLDLSETQSSSIEQPGTPETLGDSLSSSSSSSPSKVGKPKARDEDPYMKNLPEEFDPDNPPDRGLWVIYDDGPPEPANQEERLQTVHKLGLLDQDEDPVLNSMCELTSSIFKSLVAGISVVDKHRLWYHAMGGAAPRFQHHISLAFCGWNMLPTHPEVLVIEDTYLDRRFMQCPAILHPPLPGTPAMRFYAGAPLIMSNGHRIGSLCLMDVKPRTLTAEEAQTLVNLAEMAARHIEQDLYVEMQKTTTSSVNQTLLRSTECFTEATMILDMAEPKWKILYANQSWSDVTGTPHEEAIDKHLLDLYTPEDESAESLQGRVADCIQGSYGFYARFANDRGAFRLRFRAASKEFFTDNMSERTGVPSHLKAQGESQALFIAVVIPDMGPSPADTTPGSSQPSTPATLKGPTAGQEFLQGEKGVLVKTGLPAGFPEAELGILIKATPQGRIFRAQWHQSPVAIKVTEHFEEECMLIGDTGFYAPHEAALAITVAHPNLATAYKYAVAVHEAVKVEEEAEATFPSERAWVETWLVREHCARGSLTDAYLRGWLMSDRNVRSEVDLVAVLVTAAEVAGGLQALHSHDLVHGDLTGDCVWLADANTARGWSAKVLDFGAQKPHRASNSHPARRRITHASPELLEKGELGMACDVYALGVLILEMCAQDRIYSGMSMQAIFARITRREPVSDFPANLPPDIKDLIKRCMATQPENRPDIGSVRHELTNLLRAYQGQENPAADSQTTCPKPEEGESNDKPKLLKKLSSLKKVVSPQRLVKEGSPTAHCNPLTIFHTPKSQEKHKSDDQPTTIVEE